MKSMPTSQRKALFLVKSDQFKESCIPYPQRIISAVDKHLPVVANKKNDALLNIIKVCEIWRFYKIMKFVFVCVSRDQLSKKLQQHV